jgi:protocatechuate 3,4-dioxygenase beta subunit
MFKNDPMKKTLSFLSAAILASLVIAPVAGAATKSCSTTQSVEEGPYYLSDSPTRSDVTDGQEGKKITLTFTVLNASCKPIKGARVDIWYANAQGMYSGVDGNSGNYLRGTQITNAKGIATFKGIYPGWYPARTIHIHEKIWVGGQQVLTTQTYFTDKQNAAVMATAPYNLRGAQRVTNATDMVLNRGTVNLQSALMKLSGSKATYSFVVNG